MKTSTILSVCGAAALALAFLDAAMRRRADPPVFHTPKIGGWNANTLPPFGVFVSSGQKGNAALLDHEKAHWRQYRALGLRRFYGRYLGQLLRHGYDAMPMEREARFAETPFCRENYTLCVRAGLAKTVHNPGFRA